MNNKDDKVNEMTQNRKHDRQGAAVKFPPPLIFLIMILAGYGLHRLWPVGLLESTGFRFFGLGLSLVGLLTVFMLGLKFMQAKTSIEPWKPTSKIITTGLYAYSRNPIYVAFGVIVAGIGFALNSLWIVGSIIPSAILVYFIAIKKEESYLQEKFGDEYRQYKGRVRRWL